MILTLAHLDSDTRVAEVKRIRGEKEPLTAADLHALREKHTRTIAPVRALAAETLTLERTLSVHGAAKGGRALNLAGCLPPTPLNWTW